MPADQVCRRVVYHGRVQGVGFRMTAAHIARRFPIGGTVRNCADGTVELIVAGSAPEVEAFLAAVRDSMPGNITREDASEGPSGAPADRFAIVR